MKFIGIFLISLAFGVSTSLAQGGGKAEPNRIEFENGVTSAKLTGSLSNGQEMEYVFKAVKGQSVTVKNSNTNLFDFRIFNAQFDFDTEFESSRSLTFEIPGTGDYMFFVRKKQVKAPRTGRYSLELTIN